MSERERFTVMDGTTPLYDAEFDDRGNGYFLAPYDQSAAPAPKPRYPQKQVTMLAGPASPPPPPAADRG